MWSEENGLGFVDESMESSGMENEIVRCIQIGLLCVQEYPQDRPSVDTVVSMLSWEIAELSAPKQPIFSQKHSAFTTQLGCSTTTSNDLTVTELDGR